MCAGGIGLFSRGAGACLIALALIVSLASCGGDSPEATARGETKTGATIPPSAARANAERAARVEKSKASATGGCAVQLGDILDSMDGLRTRLVSGLAYEEYVGQVKTILAAYHALPADQLTLGCLREAGAPTEKALNRYIAAGNVWTDCVEVRSCEAASIEADLQGKWHRASEYLAKARRGLRQQAIG